MDFRDHFSLVRHIHGEAGHVPAEVLDAWQEAGPRQVARELTAVMATLADHGLLDVHDDRAQAVSHFMALISTDMAHRSYWASSRCHGRRPIELRRWVFGPAGRTALRADARIPCGQPTRGQRTPSSTSRCAGCRQ
ncbi:TetR/AcrR family transcriptional regulator C-terminal domain-containing protein [Micromonospora sp. URMC 106]|uniref:TetR/AcrR family transcriptional regulator C-terminal domain-containing protein n=1 Tax=Micromonospora sp. URMC 106 TaxID=3423408 RepID=UPI003F1B013B